MTAPRPVVVSLGDPDGIGPEVLGRALADPKLPAGTLRVFGPRAAFVGPWVGAALARPATEWIDLPDEQGAEALAAATGELVTGRARALVTGPVDKHRMAAHLGADFVGQTEYVAKRFGHSGAEVMMLASPRLRVALLTTHLPLRQVAERLSVQDTLRVLRTVDRQLPGLFGLARRPRLVLCGLNPHAGDGGHLGDEERRILAPAVAAACAEGLLVDGPRPADSVFGPALQGRWDAVIACYHDQGLAPLKAVAFGESVNVTLGLPGLRVSPDHGVARDIVGQGVADPSSMFAALSLALRHGRPSGPPQGQQPNGRDA